MDLLNLCMQNYITYREYLQKKYILNILKIYIMK